MDELIVGSPGHRAMTANELMSWIAYDEIVAEQRRRNEER